ncbi:MAG: hypothetical protein SGARI_005407, partial [Bacillariaceae sp.]
MNPGSEEEKTRKFLENLIENRRTQPHPDEQHQDEPQRQQEEKARQQQEAQRRRQLMGLLATRQGIGSPLLSSASGTPLLSSASGTASSPRLSFADEALRRVDEISGIRRSSLGTSFTDILPGAGNHQMVRWGVSNSNSDQRRGAGAASFFPSLNLNDPSLTSKGVVPWATASNKKNELRSGDLRKHTSGLASLAEAVSLESTAKSIASRKNPPAKRLKTATKTSMLHCPKLKDSRFFLPKLPSSKLSAKAPSNPRPFKASM